MKRIKVLSLLLLMSAASLYPAAPTDVDAGSGAGDDSGEDRRGQKRGREEEGEAVGQLAAKKQKTGRDLDELLREIGLLCAAIESQNRGKIKYIVDRNPALLDVPGVEYPHGITPLHIAVYLGYDQFVQNAIEAGADVNVQKAKGVTPLHIAAQQGYDKVVQALLLAVGVEVNAQTNIGATPLHFAARNGHANIVRALLAAGADVNATAQGFTPLSLAEEMSDNQEVIAALLMAGVDVHSRTKLGSTPLVLAAGADVNAAYEDGLTPLLVEGIVDQLPFTTLSPELLAHITQFETAEAWEEFLNKLP